MPNHKKVSEGVARPVRTGVQGGTGLILAQFIDAWIYNMNDTQFGTLVAILTVVLSAAQTFVEDYTGKGILRAIPPKEVPVVDRDERGVWQSSPIVWVLAVVGIVLLVLLLAGGLDLGR